MKKIVLMTAAAVLFAGPAFAADQNKNYRHTDASNNTYRHTTTTTTRTDRNTMNNGDETRVYISNPQEPDNQARRGSTLIVSEARQGQLQTFNLEAGGRVQINGTKAYLLSDGGSRYFAPGGSYKATNGITFVVENGVVIRAESPADVVLVDRVM